MTDDTIQHGADKVDLLLARRKYEPPHVQLADRIIAAARQLPQQEPLSVPAWLMRLFGEFHLPKPAYVFACIFIVGVGLGLAEPYTALPGDTSTQVTLYEEGDLL